MYLSLNFAKACRRARVRNCVHSNIVLTSKSAVSSATQGSAAGAPSKGSGIDETALPLRYKRKPLTTLEIEWIEVIAE